MYKFVLLILLFFASSYAYFGKENEALAVFGWSMLLQSPRSVAFEGAGSALASQDFGAAVMNPALLDGSGYIAGLAWEGGDFAKLQGIAVFSHPFLLSGSRMQHTYGVVDNGVVENIDDDGQKTGQNSYPIAQYYAITFSYPLKHFKVGVTGRYLWEQLSELENSQAGMGLALDWGLLWNTNSMRYGFAIIGRDFGRQIRPFVKGGVNGYALASEIALSSFWRSSQKMVWLFECNAPRYSPALGKFGFEYRFSEPLAIRGGIQRELLDVTRYVRSFFDDSENSRGSGFYRFFSTGIGYKFLNFTLDYSYSLLIEGMGNEHRVGLGGTF